MPDDAEGTGVEPEEPGMTKRSDDGNIGKVGVIDNECRIAGMWIVGQLACLLLEAKDSGWELLPATMEPDMKTAGFAVTS